jgi:CDP-diacylglycerol--glycerol-3-phosphate 3-phosphatidyltransferase
MTTLYDLKPAFQSLLRPGVRAMAKAGITPNTVTAAAVFASVLTGAAVALTGASPGSLLLLCTFLPLRMALNAVDGMLAREHGMCSTAGAMLNEMGDVLSDAVLYLPLALLAGISGMWVVLFTLTGILAETAGILGACIGGTRRYDGPMGKSDRAFIIGTLALALGLGVPPGFWVNAVLAASTALGALTIIRRWRKGIA